MFMFALLFYIFSFAFVIALIAGFFVMLYFIIKKAVKDGMLAANEQMNKQINEQANKQMDEQVNKEMNEQTKRQEG